MPASLNISFDLSREKAQAEALMNSTMRGAVSAQVNSFFSGDRHNAKNAGHGYKEIDELITQKFCSDDFQRRVHRYFDDNWEKIFNKVMEEALTHKANSIVFQRTDSLHKTQLPR